MADQGPEIAPGSAVGFVGLGRMGRPMAVRLTGAGYRVLGYDASQQAARDWARDIGGTAAASLTGTAAAAVILMLPDSGVVTDVLVQGGLLAVLPRLRNGSRLSRVRGCRQAHKLRPAVPPVKENGAAACRLLRRISLSP